MIIVPIIDYLQGSLKRHNVEQIRNSKTVYVQSNSLSGISSEQEMYDGGRK